MPTGIAWASWMLWAVVVINLIAFYRFAIAADRLRQQETETARRISDMMRSACLEILCATGALFLMSPLVMPYAVAWAALKTAGRCVELVYIERFSRYLYRQRAKAQSKEA